MSTTTSTQRPDLQKNVVGTIPKGMLETKGGVPPLRSQSNFTLQLISLYSWFLCSANAACTSLQLLLLCSAFEGINCSAAHVPLQFLCIVACSSMKHCCSAIIIFCSAHLLQLRFCSAFKAQINLQLLYRCNSSWLLAPMKRLSAFSAIEALIILQRMKRQLVYSAYHLVAHLQSQFQIGL